MPEPKTLRKQLGALAPYLAGWVLGIIGLTVGLYLFQNELQQYLFGHRFIPGPVERIQGYFEHYGLVGPFLFTLFFGVANSFFVPGFVLTAAAGLLFHPYVGILVVMAGLFLSAQTFYWVGRLGGDSVLNFFGDDTLDLVYRYLPERTGRVVLLCRLVFFMPFHAFNAVCGVLRVPWLPYGLSTVVGLFPRMLVYFYVGVSLRRGHGNLTLAAVFLILLVVVQSLYGAVLLQLHLKRKPED